MAGNDKDFIVKNDIRVLGKGTSLFDSGDIRIGGDFFVRGDSSVDILTIDAAGVTLDSNSVFTGDGSGLYNIAPSLTSSSIFELQDVDSGVPLVDDIILAWNTSVNKFVTSTAVASITIEDSDTVIQLIEDNIDLGNLKDVDSNVSVSGIGANPSNNDVLLYSSTAGKWVAAASPAATALADVDSTNARPLSPSDGSLFYDLDERGLYIYSTAEADWLEAAQQYASFEFVQPGTFSGTVTPTATFEPLTNITLRNVKAVTADSNHSGIEFTIDKNGTSLGQTFTIPAGQLRLAQDFSSNHVLTSTDDITLGINVPTGTGRILAVEVFYS